MGFNKFKALEKNSFQTEFQNFDFFHKNYY